MWVAFQVISRSIAELQEKEQEMKIIKTTVLGAFLTATLMTTAGTSTAKDDHEFRVPKGHMPPSGQCRIWHPGTPPGRQPAPGDCRALSRRVPHGAWLIGHDRRWSYSELRDRRFRPADFDGRRYVGRKEIHRDIRDVRQARGEVRADQRELKKNYEELQRDRAELKKDIRSGASRKEIAQGRREIREDLQKVAESKRELRSSQNKLENARQELREDLRRR
jgi:hypothetical protein